MRPFRSSASSLAGALLLAACGILTSPNDPMPWPIDPSAVTDPARMTVEPNPAAAGALVTLRFPGGHDRGVLYAIDENFDGTWERRGLLISDANGGQPVWFPADSEDVAVEMVGIAGEGPDRVLVPPVFDTGSYRICTANAAEALCVPLEVVRD